MPKYLYYCNECDGEFEHKHSIKETLESCTLCTRKGGLLRRPSSIFLSKTKDTTSYKEKPGTLVKEAIKEAGEELKKGKREMATREYKDVE
jgi:hypothetical protein